MKIRQYIRKKEQDKSILSASKLLQTRPFQDNSIQTSQGNETQAGIEPTSKGFDLTKQQTFSINHEPIPAMGQPLQAKLMIGQPNDRYEQEADRIASQAVQQINAPATVQDMPRQQEQHQAGLEKDVPGQNEQIHANSQVQQGDVIQRVNWTGSPELGKIDLTTVVSSETLHANDEDGYVRRIKLSKGETYILKQSSEDSKAEIFATVLAGQLGVESSGIALKKVTEAEVKTMSEKISDWSKSSFEEGDEVLVMQDLGGKDLDKLKKDKEKPVLGYEELKAMGKMATVDMIIGIGDKFGWNEGSGTGRVNFGNIVLGKDGKLYPIDYDIGQANAVGDSEAFDKIVEETIKSKGMTVVKIVTDAITDKDDGLPIEMLKDKKIDEKAILEGYQEIIKHLNELSSQTLSEIKKAEGEDWEGYGAQVHKRIGALAKMKI